MSQSASSHHDAVAAAPGRPLNIAVLTTGGTIGSVFAPASIVLDAGGARLRDRLWRIAERHGVRIEPHPILNMGSEDMSLRDLGRIVDEIERLRQANVQRILVTHGTDVLAFSAFAATLFHRGSQTVAFTGAFQPPDAPGSDAEANLEAALGLLASPAPPVGVFAVFGGPCGRARVLPAQGLELPGRDADHFTADEDIGMPLSRAGGVDCSARRASSLQLPDPISPGTWPVSCRAVFLTQAAPGMTLRQIEATPDLKVVIIGAYHSGTASSTSDPDDLIAFRRRNPQVTVIVTPVPAAIASRPYDTTLRLGRAGVRVYAELRPYQAYLYFSLGLAQGRSLPDLLGRLSPLELTPP